MERLYCRTELCSIETLCPLLVCNKLKFADAVLSNVSIHMVRGLPLDLNIMLHVVLPFPMVLFFLGKCKEHVNTNDSSLVEICSPCKCHVSEFGQCLFFLSFLSLTFTMYICSQMETWNVCCVQ